MGTPEFASGCLKALVNDGLNVVAVVTMPDKPIGRGQKTGMSDVKRCALELGLPILQPQKLKDPVFLKELADFRADLQIVVAFRMLPQEVWSMPHLGTFNLHASLLPLYRGAAPIQRAIWNGEIQSGVTTFLLDKDLDTGAILYQEKTAITAEETAGSLHDKLLRLGAPLVVKTARDLFAGNITPKPQTVSNEAALPTAPKIFKQDCFVDFNMPAEKVFRQIKALSPYPGAIGCLQQFSTQKTLPVKLLDASLEQENEKSYEQGRIISDNKHFVKIVCGDNRTISITKIQLAGKKQLTIEEFLRGFRLDVSKDLFLLGVINNQ
ncbi:MAG: methionyl-tRNA formyltransferase [Lentimicrobiaceae bacterium]|nr:methionyl-tRNA formyltransferase [Lentimicrobiaceae bacterium]